MNSGQHEIYEANLTLEQNGYKVSGKVIKVALVYRLQAGLPVHYCIK